MTNMKLLIIQVLFALVLATDVFSIPTNNELINDSALLVTSNFNNIDATTETVKTSTSENDEITSEEVEEIVSKLKVFLVEINEDVLQKCVVNNNTDALIKAKDADDTLTACFLPLLEPMLEWLPEIESGGLKTFRNVSDHYCRYYPKYYEKCLNEYYDSIRPCLSEADFKGIEMYDKILNAATEYLCKYDVYFLFEAFENEFGCTRAKHVAGFAFCLIPPVQEVLRLHKTPLAIPRSLVGKGCQLFKDMTQCVEKELSTCQNARYSNVIVGLFNAAANTLPKCSSPRTEWEEHVEQALENLYKEEKTQTSLLKLVKMQLDQLIASNAKLKFRIDEKKNI